jgi:Ca2+-binding RTX toxin-like protein
VCDWSPAAGVRVDLGDGDDWGDVSDELPANARFTLSGGAGNDKLQADVQGSTLDGGPGNDTPLGAHGERGNARTLKFVVR